MEPAADNDDTQQQQQEQQEQQQQEQQQPGSDAVGLKKEAQQQETDNTDNTDEHFEDKTARGWRAWVTLGEHTNPALAATITCMFSLMVCFILNGALPSVLTTFQSVYGLNSFQSGWIVSSAEVVACVLVLPVGVIGGRVNKPKMIAISGIIMAFGNVLFTFPYFVPLQAGSNTALTLFILGAMLNGFGNTALFVLTLRKQKIKIKK